MAKRIMQFRYYGEKDTAKNQPSNISRGNLAKGSIFKDYIPIVQLGIQTLPGTKFYLNNSKTPIVVGSTGIYELDLYGLSEITEIHFDLSSIDAISKNNNGYLIVDVISN